jgi:hypothetical protein
VVECLPSKHKALSTKPGAAKQKKKKKKRQRREEEFGIICYEIPAQPVK